MTSRRILALMVMAQAIDALTFAAFYWWIGPGLLREQNPFALAIMAVGSWQAVVAWKIGGVLLLAWLLPRPYKPSRFRFIREHYPRARDFMVALIIALGVVGAGFNVASIALSIQGGLA